MSTVVAGILTFDGKILAMKRGNSRYAYLSHKFEFPGGKQEEGETCPQALVRELKEELDIDIDPQDLEFFTMAYHRYPDFYISLHCYIIRMENSAFIMKEHESFRWLSPDELQEVTWADADMIAVNRLIEALQSGKYVI